MILLKGFGNEARYVKRLTSNDSGIVTIFRLTPL